MGNQLSKPNEAVSTVQLRGIFWIQSFEELYRNQDKLRKCFVMPDDVIRMQQHKQLFGLKHKNLGHFFAPYSKVLLTAMSMSVATGASWRLCNPNQVALYGGNTWLADVMRNAMGTRSTIIYQSKYANAKASEYKTLFGVIIKETKTRSSALYKGFLPTLLRSAPNTIFTFMLYEQVRRHLSP